MMTTNKPRTIKLSEYQKLQSEYEAGYEAGRTAQLCIFCDKPVIEKHANWDFWKGQGVILHQHCVVHWYQSDIALTWWMLGFGFDGDSHDHMHMFAAALGYGRFA